MEKSEPGIYLYSDADDCVGQHQKFYLVLKIKNTFLLMLFFVLAVTGTFALARNVNKEDDRFISYTVDPAKQNIQLFWKNDTNEPLRNFQNLKSWLERHKRKLVFAMNGGMYKPDNTPQGLYVENQKTLSPLDTFDGNGNFYLKPNGVFCITTNNVPFICSTKNFAAQSNVKYATQSGPMLVTDGQIHSAFKKGSANINIRNGAGILPGNKVLFAMSKKEMNLYDFANYFKRMGCKNALYLDGFVSRTYLPEKQWIQTDGNFAVMIAVTTAAD